MNLLEFIRLILKYWKALILMPLITALVVFVLTRNTKKEYVSATQVYTGIASGYGITSGEDDRIDYFAVNNSFDNLMATIKSRETIEEVAMRLLASHLLIEKSSYNTLSQESFDHLKELLPDSLRKKLVVKGSPELTYFRIESYRRGNPNNEIVQLLNSSGEIYSFDLISSNMNAARKQSSDMIDITYKSNDPAVCQLTLQKIVDVVIARYKGIKGSETNNVVKYFEEQLSDAAKRLLVSEDKLRDYSSDNKIINYNEQAKFIAESKENVIMDKQKQEMSLESSKSALKKIEYKMDMKKGLLEVNENIGKYRDQLADINYKIANAELYNEDAEKLSTFKESGETIKRQIRSEVEKQYKLNNTTEGLPRSSLLNEWLTNYLAVDENQAKLDVITQRLNGFDQLYTDFAPIGSNLKRIEREVDINEKEYLSVLHGLNMARLRQQSLQMSNNLTITDYPYLPLKPQPSKRILLVMMSFMAVFILTLATIIGKSLLGRTVQTPGRAEKFTGLQFLSAFPDYSTLHKNINQSELDHAILSHLISTLNQIISTEVPKNKQPIFILTGSNKKKEGKTVLTQKIAGKLAIRFGEILWLNPGTEAEYSQNNVKTISYQIDAEFQHATTLSEWLNHQKIKVDPYKIIIVELEEFSAYNLPSGIMSSSDINLFILDSSRVWSESDSRVLSHFTKSVKSKTLIVLNKVEIDRLESIIGEIPKHRTFARKIIKRIVTFDFKRV